MRVDHFLDLRGRASERMLAHKKCVSVYFLKCEKCVYAE